MRVGRENELKHKQWGNALGVQTTFTRSYEKDMKTMENLAEGHLNL